MAPIVTIAIVSLLAAVAPRAFAQAAPAAEAGIPNASGFLKDYARLKPVQGKEGRYVWTAPDAELKQYTRLMLPAMEIRIDRDAQYRGLSADVVQRFAAPYQTSFTRVLAPNFPC